MGQLNPMDNVVGKSTLTVAQDIMYILVFRCSSLTFNNAQCHVHMMYSDHRYHHVIDSYNYTEEISAAETTELQPGIVVSE